MNMKKKLLLVGLLVFTVSSPSVLFAQTLQFTPEFRTSLLQLIALLQRLQALNYYQKTNMTVVSTTTAPPVVVVPRIEWVTPTEGYAGSSFTIFGSGFTQTGNTVHTTYDSFTNLASADGKTITFLFAIPTGEEDGDSANLTSSSEIQSIREEIKFYVENAYGKSNFSSFIRHYK